MRSYRQFELGIQPIQLLFFIQLQCWKTRNISCGRGRARGPKVKILAGAGGRGGQISKILRARAGAGAKTEKFSGRGRARGSKLKILAGAGGRGGQK
jgi:hypothetical protein